MTCRRRDEEYSDSNGQSCSQSPSRYAGKSYEQNEYSERKSHYSVGDLESERNNGDDYASSRRHDGQTRYNDNLNSYEPSHHARPYGYDNDYGQNQSTHRPHRNEYSHNSYEPQQQAKYGNALSYAQDSSDYSESAFGSAAPHSAQLIIILCRLITNV